MSWRGYSYPDVAYKFDPSQGNNGLNGPWRIPDDLLWTQDNLILGILSKAVVLESVPVVKDYLLQNSNIEVIRQEIVYVPKVDRLPNGQNVKNELCIMMSSLVTCSLNEKEMRFFELVSALKKYYKQTDESFRVRMCLVKFPHRIWVEGLYHTRIHPVIIIPTNVFERYHETN